MWLLKHFHAIIKIVCHLGQCLIGINKFSIMLYTNTVLDLPSALYGTIIFTNGIVKFNTTPFTCRKVCESDVPQHSSLAARRAHNNDSVSQPQFSSAYESTIAL